MWFSFWRSKKRGSYILAGIFSWKKSHLVDDELLSLPQVLQGYLWWAGPKEVKHWYHGLEKPICIVHKETGPSSAVDRLISGPF